MRQAETQGAESFKDRMKRKDKALLKEIAQYGERAYRRGFQQALMLQEKGYGIDHEFASKLRHKDVQSLYEVQEGCPETRRKARLIKRPLFYRIECETIGPQIHELLVQKGSC